VIADYRVESAREFLAGARKRKVTELPPSLLIREAAELRRLLGGLLSLVDDFEDEERLHDTTRLTEGGGARISPEDTVILGQALADAVGWREYGDQCIGCEAAPSGVCDDHAADAERVAAYLQLAAALGIEVDR
jgi:hypothetical protein